MPYLVGTGGDPRADVMKSLETGKSKVRRR